MSSISTTPISMDAAHSQWASRPPDQRFETLAALHAAVDSRAKRAFESVIETSAIRAEVLDNSLVLASPKSASLLSPTHHGFGQIATRAGAPASYLRKLSTELAVENLNYGLKKLSSNEQIKLMEVDGLNDNDPTEMWSATGPDYGRIWDTDFVGAIEEIVDRTGNVFFNPKEWGGKPSGLYASDHDVFVYMIDGGSIVDGGDDASGGDRDQLHRGFFGWNSEVGDKVLGIQDFMFRMTCGNHLVWSPQNVRALKIRHNGNAPDRFAREAIPKLTEFINLSTDGYRQMIAAAKAWITPGKREDATKFIQDISGGTITNAEAKRAVAAAEREEGRYDSMWLLVQGLTATARDMAYVDARVDLERRAGKLLDLAVRKAA